MGIISVDTRSRKPIWEQLTDNIKELVFCGILQPDEQLPAVRALAAELVINPNTIAKAYSELERQGIIYTLHGRGSFVSGDACGIAEKKREKALAELTSAVNSAIGAGIALQDIIEIVQKAGGNKQ